MIDFFSSETEAFKFECQQIIDAIKADTAAIEPIIAVTVVGFEEPVYEFEPGSDLETKEALSAMFASSMNDSLSELRELVMNEAEIRDLDVVKAVTSAVEAGLFVKKHLVVNDRGDELIFTQSGIINPSKVEPSLNLATANIFINEREQAAVNRTSIIGVISNDRIVLAADIGSHLWPANVIDLSGLVDFEDYDESNKDVEDRALETSTVTEAEKQLGRGGAMTAAQVRELGKHIRTYFVT
jgi:hypothetical protein